MALLKSISEGPLEGELIYTEDDPDIPKSAKNGALITTIAAQFNPGQLLLAMLE